MIHFRINVKFRTEGECIYRKEDAVFPPLPDWSEYTWGGRTPEGIYHKGKALFPYKKRRFRHDLYYKAYHVEYWTSVRFVDIGNWRTPPSHGYLESVTQIIKPLPDECLVVRQIGYETEDPRMYLHHELYCYYKYAVMDGTLQPVLEKSEEEHYVEKWNRNYTKSKKIPVNIT